MKIITDENRKEISLVFKEGLTDSIMSIFGKKKSLNISKEGIVYNKLFGSIRLDWYDLAEYYLEYAERFDGGREEAYVLIFGKKGQSSAYIKTPAMTGKEMRLVKEKIFPLCEKYRKD